MRVLLSTIGSRGDVQPLVALALELRDRRCGVRLCVPPDFREWIEGLGLAVTPIGPELKATAKPGAASSITPDVRRRMIEGTVATQFETIGRAAIDCDIIIGATALQIAAPSVAEHLGIPYVFVAYCPTVLPSPHHPPPILASLGDTPLSGRADYSDLWAADARRWNDAWRPALNAQRALLGLAPIDEVREHVLTSSPWLAADPTLGPCPETLNMTVFQSGAWLLPDEKPLAPDLEHFLNAGDPPVYFGFGSNRVPVDLTAAIIEAARQLGKRVVVSRGWADLSLVDDGLDCISISEANLHILFKRVAAVVHHGGAGTTTAAARAGVPQLVMPQHYDQHYWARRAETLGIGIAYATQGVSSHGLVEELERVLEPSVAGRAASIADCIRIDGAAVAADRVIRDYSRREDSIDTKSTRTSPK